MRSAVFAAVVLVAGVEPVPSAEAVTEGCAPASVSVADRTLYEGTPSVTDPNPAYTTFDFTVSISAAAGCLPTGSVSYKTEDGSPGATSPSDYLATSGKLTWNGDASSRTISVQVIKDSVPEPNEPFLLRLYDPTGVNLADDLAAGGILDDDGAVGPKLEVSTDGGKICWRACEVPVHLNTPAKAPVTVYYRTLPLGEGELAYVPVKDATLTIQPGQSVGNAVVKLLPPKPGQGESKFLLEIFSPSAGTLGNARTEVTIKPAG